VDKVDYEGVLPRFERLYLKRDITKLKKSLQDEIMSLVEKAPCPTCGGAGLNPKALASRINGKNIVDYGEMTARELVAELRGVTDAMGVSLARQISAYLERMDEVCIGYLSLSRKTDTLSGGELQRIKMVRSLASSPTNITYIFDEPTAGLHPADAETISVNPSPRKWSDAFEVRNATAHNLKNVSVGIPKGVLTAVTGVAGSGKTLNSLRRRIGSSTWGRAAALTVAKSSSPEHHVTSYLARLPRPPAGLPISRWLRRPHLTADERSELSKRASTRWDELLTVR